MSDLLKRIADYFTNDYQGDDKTAPTMEITVDDLRYIANMNVEMCRAEAELRNLKYNKGKKIKVVQQMDEDELRYCHHDDTDEYHDCLDYMECEECPYYYADLDQGVE